MINRFTFLGESLQALKPILRVDDHLVAVLLVLQSTFKVHINAKVHCLLGSSDGDGTFLADFLCDLDCLDTCCIVIIAYMID